MADRDGAVLPPDADFLGTLDLESLARRIGIGHGQLLEAMFHGRSPKRHWRGSPQGSPWPSTSPRAAAETQDGDPVDVSAGSSPEGARQPGAATKAGATSPGPTVECLASLVQADPAARFQKAGGPPRATDEGRDLEADVGGAAPDAGVDIALVMAPRAPTVDEVVPAELQRIGHRSVLAHLLLGLEKAGVRVAVVLVGPQRDELLANLTTDLDVSAAVRPPSRMRLEIVDLGRAWRGSAAESVLEARPALSRYCGGAHFPRPFLLLSPDRVFDPVVLQQLRHYSGTDGGVEQIFMIVEDATDARDAGDLGLDPTLRVLTSARAKKRGAVRVESVGFDLPVYTSVETGALRVNGALFFAELERQNTQAPPTMDAVLHGLAEAHALHAVRVSDHRYRAYETSKSVMAYQAARNGMLPPLFQEAPPAPLASLAAPSKLSEEASMSWSLRNAGADGPWPRIARLAVLEHPGSPEPIPADRDRAALLSDAVAPRIRRIADQEDRALVVRLPPLKHGSLLVPARLAPGSAVAQPNPLRPLLREKLEKVLAAQVGLVLPCEVRRVRFSIHPSPHGVGPAKLDAPRQLFATVEQAVPLSGWVVLIIATLASGLSGGIAAGTLATVRPPLVQVWRSAAACLAAVPIFVLDLRRRRPSTGIVAREMPEALQRGASGGDPMDPRETTPLLGFDRPAQLPASSLASALGPLPAALANGASREEVQSLGSGGFWTRDVLAAVTTGTVSAWASHACLYWALTSTTQSGLVIAASSLAPAFLLMSRFAGIVPGGSPNLVEAGGATLGVLSALVGAVTLQDLTWGHRVAMGGRDLKAVVAGVAAAGFIAAAVVSVKVARQAGVSAPTLHMVMQGGSLLLSIGCLIATEGIELSLDPDAGLFGCLSPSLRRLPAFAWMGIGVETLGTLGYVAVMKHIGPLMVLMAVLLQSSVGVYEEALLGFRVWPTPQFALGSLLLLGATIAVGTAQARLLTRTIGVRVHNVETGLARVPEETGDGDGKAVGLR